MIFFTYEGMKRHNQERTRRSLAKYEMRRQLLETPKASTPPLGDHEADVIELMFGAQCEHQIGA